MTPRVPAAAAALLTLVALAGCVAAPQGVVVIGTVDDDLTTVSAAALAAPVLSLDAGFPAPTGRFDPVSGRTSPAISTVAAAWGVGSTVRVRKVAVTVGDTVRAGQVLARLDTGPLDAAVGQAKADAAVLAASVDVLAARIEETGDARADLLQTRTDVEDAIVTATRARQELRRARATIRRNLPRAVAGLAAIREAIAALPPGVPVPPELAEQERRLARAVRTMRAGLRRINAALPKVNAGIRKARAGLRRIDDGLASVADARGSLTDAHRVLALQATAGAVGVDVIRAQRALAVLVAPVDGVVVEAAAAGDQVAPGATVVALREQGPATVTAWLSTAQLGQVCTGDPATLAPDGAPSVRATLTRIGSRADYPPTSMTTEEVHLTRAVRVQFTATAALPAGTPVEITVDACHPAGDPSRTGK